MNNVLIWFVVFDVFLDISSSTNDVQNEILNYFDSETVRNFQDRWESQRKSFENAIKIALQESFGQKGMNIVTRQGDAGKLSSGFYSSAYGADVVLQDMYLKELPRLISPEVCLALSNNVFVVKAGLSDMIVETEYFLFRNKTPEFSLGPDLQRSSMSPFNLNQVQNSGHLAIIAEDCSLSGFTIATLIGPTVNLGHDTFRVTDCNFRIEISKPGLGSPPLIASYFFGNDSRILENLLTKPIRGELITKLQAAAFTYMNTSAIFGQDLRKYRQKQQKVFKDTETYVEEIIQENNRQSREKNQGVEGLNALKTSWNDMYNNDSPYKGFMVIDNVTVSGFDSAYTPHNGGPYKSNEIGIAEVLRFNTLKVQGNFIFGNEDTIREHTFVVELQDVTANMNIDISGGISRQSRNNLWKTDTFVLWRSMELSVLNLGTHLQERLAVNSIISGYIGNEITKLLTKGHPNLPNPINIKKYQTSFDASANMAIDKDTSFEDNDNKENRNTEVSSQEDLNIVSSNLDDDNNDDRNQGSEQSLERFKSAPEYAETDYRSEAALISQEDKEIKQKGVFNEPIFAIKGLNDEAFSINLEENGFASDFSNSRRSKGTIKETNKSDVYQNAVKQHKIENSDFNHSHDQNTNFITESHKARVKDGINKTIRMSENLVRK